MKKILKIICISIISLLLIAGIVFGAVYYWQGLSVIDKNKSALKKDFDMVFDGSFGQHSLISKKINNAIKNNEETIDPGLTITKNEAKEEAEEIVEKYNLNEGFKYNFQYIDECKVEITSGKSAYSLSGNRTYYRLLIAVDKKYPKIILNSDIKRKNIIIMYIDDTGLLFISVE